MALIHDLFIVILSLQFSIFLRLRDMCPCIALSNGCKLSNDERLLNCFFFEVEKNIERNIYHIMEIQEKNLNEKHMEKIKERQDQIRGSMNYSLSRNKQYQFIPPTDRIFIVEN